MQYIGAIFKNLRKEKRLSLKDAASAAGINTPFLNRIEMGKCVPTNEQFALLCKLYNVKKEQLSAQWFSDIFFSALPDEESAILALSLAKDKIQASLQSRHIVATESPKRLPLKSFYNKVIEGDCLDIMQGIPDRSIDMILCDLPYGTTQNKWDSVIDLKKLWVEYERIIKDNGAIALTAQGVFTARLILSNEKLFRYKIVWVKSKATNFLNAKLQPLRKHEDICIFYKQQPIYNPQMTEGEPYDKGIRKDQYTGSYGDFRPHHVKSTGGSRYPTDVLEIELNESDGDCSFYRIGDREFELDNINEAIYVKTAESEGKVLHPTQKPVRLARLLVRTFTRPGDVVLDNTCGSGSFIVGALLEGRKFIGIEKNEGVMLHKKEAIDYIAICNERIANAQKELSSE